MDKQYIAIGRPLHVAVYWYDRLPEPPEQEVFEGEIVGWRESQVIVRVPSYAVLRFWKKNGLEVGNGGHERRGYRVDLSELTESIKPAQNNKEIEIDLPVAVDTDA